MTGHDDATHTRAYAVGISQRRANSVVNYLESRGIASYVISTQAMGQSRPRVPTADGVREPQHRRVEITFGR